MVMLLAFSEVIWILHLFTKFLYHRNNIMGYHFPFTVSHLDHSGIRIPASFLAGSSLAAMFIFKTKATDLTSSTNESKLTKLERRVLGFYHISSLLAFLLSLNTIATATIAVTAVLHGRFDQMAETAYMMMRREFEYEL